jgi:hypothetical protein
VVPAGLGLEGLAVGLVWLFTESRSPTGAEKPGKIHAKKLTFCPARTFIMKLSLRRELGILF